VSLSYWDHIEPFWESVSIYDGPEEFLLGFTEMPEHAAHLLAVHWCASEVRNGGFHQFFFNSTGVLAPEAVTGFRAIAMPRAGAILGAAMASFGEPYPRDREERQDALAALVAFDPETTTDDDWDNPFTELDRRFYDVLGRENGGLDQAAGLYAARFPVPDGPLTGALLLNRLLAALRQEPA